MTEAEKKLQRAVDRVAAILGPAVKRIREAREMTQAELGKAAGYSGKSAIVTINRIEAGKNVPRLVGLFALADALEVTPHDLLNPNFDPKKRRRKKRRKQKAS